MIGRAPFGATGHDSSRVVFGAAALAEVSQSEADRALDVLLLLDRFRHGIDRLTLRLERSGARLNLLHERAVHSDHRPVANRTMGRDDYRRLHLLEGIEGREPCLHAGIRVRGDE